MGEAGAERPSWQRLGEASSACLKNWEEWEGWRRDKGKAPKCCGARPFMAPWAAVRVPVFTLRAKRGPERRWEKGGGETRPTPYPGITTWQGNRSRGWKENLQ